MGKADSRYIQNAEHFFDQVAAVWIAHAPEDKLRSLYDSLPTDDEKNLFLRVGAFYRYLVKEGSYLFKNDEWKREMSFIDDTYKYVALFALIEALEVSSQYLDFYEWIQREAETKAIIVDANLVKTLEPLYHDYKAKYGSTQAVVTFFSRLNAYDQKLIRERLRIHKKEASLRKLALILYDIRSKFVHEARFVLWFGSLTTIGYHNDNVLTSNLTISDLCTLFEHGFLRRFGWKENAQQSPPRVRLRSGGATAGKA